MLELDSLGTWGTLLVYTPCNVFVPLDDNLGGGVGYMTSHRVMAPKLCGTLLSSVMVSTVAATMPPMKITAETQKQ